MKAIAAAIFVILLSCSSQPPIYITVPAAPPAAPEVDFWALYTGPSQSGMAGFMDIDQQAAMILYTCQRYSEISPNDFKEVYGNFETCRKAAVDGYKNARYILEKMQTWQNVSETIGYYCMGEAFKKYCDEKIGWCIWDGVWLVFDKCLETEK